MNKLEELLLEFYADMFEVEEDAEYPDPAQRRAAARDVLGDYVERIEEASG